MDINETVTEFQEMKRGNYAVSNSDSAWLDAIIRSTISSINTSNDIREDVVGNNRQEGPSQADVNGSYNRHETGSLCAEHRVQGEPIQRGFAQQVQRSTWSMAITVGKTRVVITQTDTRSTQVCATPLRNLVRGVQVPPGKELVLTNESV